MSSQNNKLNLVTHSAPVMTTQQNHKPNRVEDTHAFLKTTLTPTHKQTLFITKDSQPQVNIAPKKAVSALIPMDTYSDVDFSNLDISSDKSIPSTPVLAKIKSKNKI